MAHQNILKYTKYTMLVAGALQMLTKTRLSFPYKAWSYFSQAYFFTFCVSVSAGMPNAPGDEETQNFNKQAFVLCFLLLWRLALSYTGRIRKVIEEVRRVEEEITREELEIVGIYEENARRNHKIFFFLIIIDVLTCLLFTVNGVEQWGVMRAREEAEVKTFAFAGRFPFDAQRYFGAAYVFQLTNGFFICLYSVTFDTLFISLMVFAKARLEVLGHKIEHLGMYSAGRSETPSACLRDIIVEHQAVEIYVEDLNASLKWYFFGDFLVKSYHISLVLTNIMHGTEALMFHIFLLMHLTCQVCCLYYSANELSLEIIHANEETILFYIFILMFLLSQVFCFYYHANEILLESTNLCGRIFDSEWYDQSSEVKRSLMIAMTRARKPLILTIGNLHVINNELIVKIIKAAYTFLLCQKLDI